MSGRRRAATRGGRIALSNATSAATRKAPPRSSRLTPGTTAAARYTDAAASTQESSTCEGRSRGLAGCHSTSLPKSATVTTRSRRSCAHPCSGSGYAIEKGLSWQGAGPIVARTASGAIPAGSSQTAGRTSSGGRSATVRAPSPAAGRCSGAPPAGATSGSDAAPPPPRGSRGPSRRRAAGRSNSRGVADATCPINDLRRHGFCAL